MRSALELACVCITMQPATIPARPATLITFKHVLEAIHSQQRKWTSEPTIHKISLFDCLEARAGLKLGTAPGQDGIAPEAYKLLPFICVIL